MDTPVTPSLPNQFLKNKNIVGRELKIKIIDEAEKQLAGWEGAGSRAPPLPPAHLHREVGGEAQQAEDLDALRQAAGRVPGLGAEADVRGAGERGRGLNKRQNQDQENDEAQNPGKGTKQKDENVRTSHTLGGNPDGQAEHPQGSRAEAGSPQAEPQFLLSLPLCSDNANGVETVSRADRNVRPPVDRPSTPLRSGGQRASSPPGDRGPPAWTLRQPPPPSQASRTPNPARVHSHHWHVSE